MMIALQDRSDLPEAHCADPAQQKARPGRSRRQPSRRSAERGQGDDRTAARGPPPWGRVLAQELDAGDDPDRFPDDAARVPDAHCLRGREEVRTAARQSRVSPTGPGRLRSPVRRGTTSRRVTPSAISSDQRAAERGTDEEHPRAAIPDVFRAEGPRARRQPQVDADHGDRSRAERTGTGAGTGPWSQAS